MKIFYSISISLFLAIILRGQSPTFAPIGSKWGYTYSAFASRGDYIKEAVGDTVIKGRICRKFKTTAKIIDCIGGPTCLPERVSIRAEFIAQRQDSIFYYDQTDSSFAFIYHFHAQVGDTMTVVNYRTIFKYVCTRSVDTIFGGVTLKKWQFKSVCNSPSNSNYPIILLEKVGALASLFGMENTCVIAEMGYSLCSFKSENVNFQRPVCITTTAENTLSDAVQISPNPANSALTIASNHSFVTIRGFVHPGPLVCLSDPSRRRAFMPR